MKKIFTLFLTLISLNLYAYSQKDLEDQKHLNKAFGICHISFLESGNEYLYRQCSDIVFEKYQERYSRLEDEVKHKIFQEKVSLNKKICVDATHQTRSNKTILRDLVMCDFIYYNSMLQTEL